MSLYDNMQHKVLSFGARASEERGATEPTIQVRIELHAQHWLGSSDKIPVCRQGIILRIPIKVIPLLADYAEIPVQTITLPFSKQWDYLDSQD